MQYEMNEAKRLKDAGKEPPEYGQSLPGYLLEAFWIPPEGPGGHGQLTLTVEWFGRVQSRLPDNYARMMEFAGRLNRLRIGFYADRKRISYRVASHVHPVTVVEGVRYWFTVQAEREYQRIEAEAGERRRGYEGGEGRRRKR